jgi:hypothetical protein
LASDHEHQIQLSLTGFDLTEISIQQIKDDCELKIQEEKTKLRNVKLNWI